MNRSLPMLPANLRAALRELGWRGVDVKADLRAFQYGWNLGPPLAVDGVNGPLTREAVRLSLRRQRTGLPSASPSFAYGEFACGCGGRLPGCRGVLVDRQLLVGLETYRHVVGGPVVIVSGYRCRRHNQLVGGAKDSQHVYGGAADVAYRLRWRDVARLHVFGGIGRSHRTGLVRHVDVRHINGHNTTGATALQPTTWDYAA